MKYQTVKITPERKEELRRKFLETPEITPLKTDPKFFSLLVSLGIHQEIGTIHDELSTFLFDGDTGLKIPRERFRSELIEVRGHFGVRIWADGIEHLDPRVRGLRTLMQPELSYTSDGRLGQLVFFPEIITEIAALAGAELVSVKPWGLNTIFGGFDPSRSYYEGNMWEFINVDAVRYAHLLERRQIVFWGTHDLVSHVAGIRIDAWPELEERGREARKLFERYFDGASRPAPSALVLPYALGMLLDDLAQPMNYDSQSRRHIVGLLTDAIERRVIRPEDRSYLLKYPPSIERLIGLARSDDLELARREGESVLEDVVREIRQYSWGGTALGPALTG